MAAARWAIRQDTGPALPHGSNGQPHSGGGVPTLTFTLDDGRSVRPDWLTHRFHHLVMESGLPAMKFYYLGNGAATRALAAQVDLKVVQDTLGHACIAFTADTYATVLPGIAHAAAEATAVVS